MAKWLSCGSWHHEDDDRNLQEVTEVKRGKKEEKTSCWYRHLLSKLCFGHFIGSAVTTTTSCFWWPPFRPYVQPSRLDRLPGICTELHTWSAPVSVLLSEIDEVSSKCDSDKRVGLHSNADLQLEFTQKFALGKWFASVIPTASLTH